MVTCRNKLDASGKATRLKKEGRFQGTVKWLEYLGTYVWVKWMLTSTGVGRRQRSYFSCVIVQESSVCSYTDCAIPVGAFCFTRITWNAIIIFMRIRQRSAITALMTYLKNWKWCCLLVLALNVFVGLWCYFLSLRVVYRLMFNRTD